MFDAGATRTFGSHTTYYLFVKQVYHISLEGQLGQNIVYGRVFWCGYLTVTLQLEGGYPVRPPVTCIDISHVAEKHLIFRSGEYLAVSPFKWYNFKVVG